MSSQEPQPEPITLKPPQPRKAILTTLALAASGALIAALFTGVLAAERGSLPGAEDGSVRALALPTDNEIANFAYVHPYLMRGAMPTPYGMEWLKQHGVRTIIDLRQKGSQPVELERETAGLMGFRFINLSVNTLPSARQVRQFVETVDKAKESKEPVFVHCNYGSDRTGFFVAAWRVAGDGWRPTLAAAEMLEHGFFVHKFGPSRTHAISDRRNWEKISLD